MRDSKQFLGLPLGLSFMVLGLLGLLGLLVPGCQDTQGSRSDDLADAGDTIGNDADSDTPVDASSDDSQTIDFACPGGSLVPGLNSIQVGDGTRSFFADFPADTAQPLAVLFSWHGYGQDTNAFRGELAFNPDQDPGQGVVIITPEDTGFNLPEGLDWDIRGRSEGTNIDVVLFESILGCLDEQYNVDASRVYSFGFSAGSVMTSLLQSSHPTLLSAVVAVSGAWFNDPVQVGMVNFFNINWAWPDLQASDGGAVLLTHGGPSDVTALNILNLENANQAAIPFLKDHGRVVVDCAHTSGHALHPEIRGPEILRFLLAHRAGQASPYLNGPLQGFPDSCAIR